MKKIIEFLILPFEDIRCTLIILVSTIALISLILFFLQRKQRLNICVCVKFEEYLISFFLAIVCFGFFYLHYSIIFWIIFYFSFRKIEKSNRKIRYAEKVFEKKGNSLTRNHYNLYSKIQSEQFFRENGGLFSYLKTKKKLVEKIEVDENNKNFGIYSFLSVKIYASGLIFPAVLSFLRGSQYSKNDLYVLRLIESWIILGGILHFLYPIFRYLTVENELSRLYDHPKQFLIYYIIFCVLLYAIAVGITR